MAKHSGRGSSNSVSGEAFLNGTLDGPDRPSLLDFRNSPPHTNAITLALWDQPQKALEKNRYTSKSLGIAVMNFVTKLSKLEETFGAALIELSTSFLSTEIREGKTLTNSWNSLLKLTKSRGEILKKSSVQSKDAALKQLQQVDVDKMLERPTKRLELELSSKEKIVKSKEIEMDKCKTKLETLKLGMLKNAKQMYKKNHQVDMPESEYHKLLKDDEAWKKFFKSDKDEKKAAEAEANFALISEEVKIARDEYKLYLTAGFAAQQKDMLLRSDLLQKSMRKLAEKIERAGVDGYKASLACMQTCKLTNIEKDLEELLAASSSGEPCPWLQRAEEGGGAAAAELSTSRKASDMGDRPSKVVWKPKQEGDNLLSTRVSPSVSASVLGKSESKRDLVKQRHAASTSARSKQLGQALANGDLSLSPTAAAAAAAGVSASSSSGKEEENKADANAKERKGEIYSSNKVETKEDKKVGETAEDRLERKSKGESSEASDAKAAGKSKAVSVEDLKVTVPGSSNANDGTRPLSPIQVEAGPRSPLSSEASTVRRNKESNAASAYNKEKEDKQEEHAKLVDNTNGAAWKESLGHSAALEESVGNFDLRTPIVIDNGSAFIKAGFSGQKNPSLVVPSVYVSTRHPYPDPLTEEEKETIRYDKKGNRRCRFAGAHTTHVGKDLVEARNSQGNYVPDANSVDVDGMDSSVYFNSSVFTDSPQSWEDLENIWEHVLDGLGASESVIDHPVLLTQPTLAPISLKKKMTEIWYETFNVPCLYVATSPLLAAYAYGSSTGLVVDIGESSAQVLPLVDGYLLKPHVRRARHLGGMKDSERIIKYFHERTAWSDPLERGKYPTPFHLSMMARGIKDRLALTAASKSAYDDEMQVLEDAEGFLGGGDPDEDLDKRKGKPQTLTVNPLSLQRELLRCGEVLFQPKELLNDRDTSITSVPDLVVQVANACDLDTRVQLLSNIFLSGGVTTMRGFDKRFEAELRELLPFANYIQVFGSQRRYAAWVGGSVLSAMDEFKDSWEWKEDYFDGKIAPVEQD